MSTPVLPIEILIKACASNRSIVVVWGVAIKDAEVFKLVGSSAILDFFEQLDASVASYKSTLPFEQWKGKSPAPMVESYVIPLGSKYAYIAYFQSSTGVINIKSFKENESQRMLVKCEEINSKISLKNSPFKKDKKALLDFFMKIENKKDGGKNE